MERFELSDVQAQAIVNMRLYQLTGLEQDKLHANYEEVQKLIAHLEEILNDETYAANSSSRNSSKCATPMAIPAAQ